MSRSAPKVWIDLASSPHPLIFEPICSRLEAEGATVVVTVRDHAQTLELSRRRWPGATPIGGPALGGRVSKALELAARVRDLARWARAERPDVALSHNSYAQILAARLVGVPAVTAMDYEYQPANHIAFRGASRILLPEAIPAKVVARQGAGSSKVIRYPGYKEALYLRDLPPIGDVLGQLGVDGGLVAVARAAAAGAAYHPGDNPLFLEALRELGARAGMTTVVLARHPGQREAIARLGLPSLVLPDEAVDARSLLRAADLFVGAGGTMCREAALLGVPAYSIFAGRPPAVDLRLEKEGLLMRLDHVDQFGALRTRANGSGPRLDLIRIGGEIEDIFVSATLEAAGGR